jgi:hypothetical protein
MSKIKIGDRVQIKSSGEYLEGVVLDCIINIDYESKHCKKTWLIKPDGAKSFSEYKTCTRKEIGKLGCSETVRPISVKETIVTPLGEYKLLLVGHLTEGPRCECFNSKNSDGFVVSSCVCDSSVKKTLSIGWAICAPGDVWDWDRGYKIAIHRAKTRAFSKMYTTNNGEFDNSTIIAILKAKVPYFKKNWQRFITVNKEEKRPEVSI